MKSALVALTAILSVAMPVVANGQLLAPLANLTAGPRCPLGRVATVRGGDSEAKDGGGFYAKRRNGMHGAVDLNGWVGEAVFAVANGKVAVAARSDWGKLGKTVVIDHLDGGFTIYGHLHTIEVNVKGNIAAGDMIGTIGYTGNATDLRTKNLSPHLHFAYVRTFAGMKAAKAAPVARAKERGEDLPADVADDSILAGMAGVLHPMWAVRPLKCWEEAPSAVAPAAPSTPTMLR